MRFALCAVATLALATSGQATSAPLPDPIALPADLNVKTVVDGKTFRVRAKARTVWVYRKSLYVMPTPELMHAMRQAVRQATGCEATDYYFVSAAFTGMLDCSGRADSGAGAGDDDAASPVGL
ncbi:MAG: hypothetical protein WCZ28_11265 [Burkholderiaceae bacterium]